MANSENNIFDLCAPVSGGSTSPPQGPSLWGLSKRGLGYTGSKSLSLACIIEKRTNEFGGFAGEVLYPVAAAVQHDPHVGQHVRHIEFHSTMTATGDLGLLYYKTPISGLPPNSWLATAQLAVHASIERWGHFASDHNIKGYHFVPAHDQLPAPDKLPNPRKLVEELLGESVITSLEHPVISQLLGLSVTSNTNSTGGEEDEDAY